MDGEGCCLDGVWCRGRRYGRMGEWGYGLWIMDYASMRDGDGWVMHAWCSFSSLSMAVHIPFCMHAFSLLLKIPIPLLFPCVPYYYSRYTNNAILVSKINLSMSLPRS